MLSDSSFVFEIATLTACMGHELEDEMYPNYGERGYTSTNTERSASIFSDTHTRNNGEDGKLKTWKDVEPCGTCTFFARPSMEISKNVANLPSKTRREVDLGSNILFTKMNTAARRSKANIDNHPNVLSLALFLIHKYTRECERPHGKQTYQG